jgi:GNAT superfamily N-acetyltransferase
MNDYIAYCGLDCERCEARLATVNNDDSLRQKIAHEWSELNGAEITPEMINCSGCRIEGVKTPYCDSLCPIRQCAMSRGIETCGSCSEMDGCEKLGMIVKNNQYALRNLKEYSFIALRDRPELKDLAASWFHKKWGVPKQAYLDCMTEYLDRETEYGWYLCMNGERIVGGLGVIDNDFHDRKDLTPNVCAVYTEETCRGQGIAGRLLDMAVDDMRTKGITPLYLVTDHIGFYERYGWEFLCMVQGDGEPEMTRMYIHR